VTKDSQSDRNRPSRMIIVGRDEVLLVAAQRCFTYDLRSLVYERHQQTTNGSAKRRCDSALYTSLCEPEASDTTIS
jgi:hypothetical protein